MTLPAPDLFTAYSLIALTAFALAWLLQILGRPFWRQGIPYAIFSMLLWALAYLCFALQSKPGEAALPFAAKTLISAALAAFTVALHRFRQSSEPLRDGAIWLVPIAASLAFALMFLPTDISAFNRMQTTVAMLQTVYLLAVLLPMRIHTPGPGWVLITCAAGAQLIATLLPILGQDVPLHDAPLLWAMCVALLLQLSATASGFLRMQQDRQSALTAHAAPLDSLTQLPGRTAFMSELDRAIKDALQKNRALAVMMIDIDHFKRFNQLHGHLAGDQLIRMLGKMLQEQSRGKDFVARFGGEEFALVLPGTDEQEALIMAQRLCRLIRNASVPRPSGDPLQVTVSVGIYSCTPSSAHESARAMLEQASKAVREAKTGGRNRIVISTTPASPAQSGV